MIQKDIIYFHQPAVIACDEKCNKAWGIQERPRHFLSGDPEEVVDSDADEHMRRNDDYVYLADSDLGTAPIDACTTAGGHGKPTCPEERLNKWCCRQCERCWFGKPTETIKLKDLENPTPNMPTRQPSSPWLIHVGEQP